MNAPIADTLSSKAKRPRFLPRLLPRAGAFLKLAASGAVAALAFPPAHLVFVLPFAFLMLMRAIDGARDMRQAAWAGFAFGLGLHTAGLYWLTNAILIRASEFWWFVPLAAPGCAVILAPFAAVPAALSRLAPSGWRRGALFAGVWTLCDMGRAFLFSGFTWNPLGSDWAFHGFLGDVMIQLAAWIGVDGLTLLTVLLAVLMPLGRREALLGVAVLFLWGVVGAWRFETVASGVKADERVSPIVVLAQGNVAEKEKIDRADVRTVFERYLRLTSEGVNAAVAEAASAQGPARPVVYVWPETAFPGVLEEEPVARSMIARAATGAAAGMIGSLRQASDGHWRNSVIALDDSGAVKGAYDKARLVPFGEYQPAFIPLQIVPGGGMTPGPGPVTWRLPGLAPVGPLVCYEVIFSGHVVDRRHRPDWIVNVTNDAWYGDSAGPRQHLAAVRMRAVEEGLPVARAANTGVSIVYDARGHDMGRLEWGREGVLVRALPPALPPPFFARFGQEIPLVLCVLTIVVAVLGRRFLPISR
ncbi:apolipoprotein N-acyltransferase [Acetobacter nitrogenifigens DSM 23921 = NBRC 105050]|uniref:Apolipoprotein N-acyltransferase n=1 Tax=Acetobacter nitrogenifigens DSM 23921 = NBRC 105050 TaxID=1120919 RepID=A0A511X6X9_9PROT|nr:apolipoprotein N-acyltransferase [Acetobacter nitrogenifigens]GBQ95078.1 apolipoprotein N-acyltransferase [Acetobacter nitrogenifigens DSM 23921 = NBRC 105050]GEN58704.1 apolipoprotein N-acyltransferase [Acetobacter nitrogenifigens DSM 23921 = NBRC 105050]